MLRSHRDQFKGVQLTRTISQTATEARKNDVKMMAGPIGALAHGGGNAAALPAQPGRLAAQLVARAFPAAHPRSMPASARSSGFSR
jgi:hypothetical protein